MQDMALVVQCFILIAKPLRTLEVKSPNDDVREWLKKKSQTELWSIVQHGNPQEIIPYSIALSSHLNQVVCRNTVHFLFILFISETSYLFTD